MAKVVDVKYAWTKSTSATAKQVAVLTINGSVTRTDLPADAESFLATLPAGAVTSFVVETYDAEGLMAPSLADNYTVGTLSLPFPAVGLTHQILAVRDVP